MKKCAVILKGDEIVKIYNYPTQYKALQADPNIIIYEECDEDRLDEKAAYWERIINYDPVKEREKEQQVQLIITKNKRTSKQK